MNGFVANHGWQPRFRAYRLVGLAFILLMVIAATLPSARGVSATLLSDGLDGAFRATALEIPGFAGIHMDADADEVIVLMTAGAEAQADTARTIVSAHLGDPELLAKPMSVKTVRYDFRELFDWKQSLSAVAWTDMSVVFTDIDEERNRITIGSLSPQDTFIHIDTADLPSDIPGDAWDVVEAEMPNPTTSLQDHHRPLVGGLQISRSAGSVNYLCTLGFIAYRGGIPGMVTNSHCSSQYLNRDSTTWGQPNPTLAIAVEARDPSTFTGGACPSGFRCRYSDAAWARLETSTLLTTVVPEHQRGRIATPGSFGTPTSWNGIDKFEITSKGNPLVNDPTSFVGRTSGRKSGLVSRTCVDTGVGGHPDVKLLCQTVADFPASGGDSGAPMFRTTAPGPSSRLQGILWGTTSVSSYYSTIGNIQRSSELGSLNVCTTTSC